MSLAAGILIWIAAGLLRLVFVVAGWFLVPLSLIGSGAEQTHSWFAWVYGDVADIPEKAKASRWTKYVEMAWRNPTTGLDALFAQPVPEERPNPDQLVRNIGKQSATRFMRDGVFWEYWRLSKINRGPFAERFLEIRIGWKFVDGNEDFTPTFQFGPKR